MFFKMPDSEAKALPETAIEAIEEPSNNE